MLLVSSVVKSDWSGLLGLMSSPWPDESSTDALSFFEGISDRRLSSWSENYKKQECGIVDDGEVSDTKKIRGMKNCSARAELSVR